MRGPVTSPIIHDWDDNDDEAVDSGNSQSMDRIDVDNPTDGIHHGQSDDRAQGAPVVENDNVSFTDGSGGSQPIDRAQDAPEQEHQSTNNVTGDVPAIGNGQVIPVTEHD